MSQKHKLSIYLVKKGIKKNQIFKERISSIKIGCGELFLKVKNESSISWKKFFNNHKDLNNLLNNNHSAIFLVNVNDRYFVLSFGAAGRHMLNNDVLEDDFGLKTVLNLIDTENLRSIDKRDMSGISKNTREQVSRNGKIIDFGINPEYDLIYGITGKSEDSSLGDMITGKKALSGSFEVDCDNVDNILKEYLKYYNKENYKKKFPWIDNIKEVQNGKQIDKFNKRLLQDLNENIYKNGEYPCWLSVPDIVDWNNVVGFSFSKSIKSNQDNLKTDLFINQLSEIYKDKDKEITIKSLENKRIYCFDGDGNLAGDGSWSIYNCIYCEITFNGKIILINNMNKFLISFLSFFAISFLFAEKVSAVCPVCTVAVGAGVGVSRSFGVDDLIIGLWVGGLLVSVIMWTINWFNKKNISFKGRNIITILSYYALSIIPLYLSEIIGNPINAICGCVPFDKLLVGIIVGSISFFVGAKYYYYLKEKNGGHAYFPFQKVVMPIAPLIILSIIFYFLVK